MVVAGSLYPEAGPPKINNIRFDLILHLAVYALLSGLAMIIFDNSRTAILALWVSIAMLSLGFLLELGQLYIKGRTFDTEDIVANSLGVLVGVVLGIAGTYLKIR